VSALVATPARQLALGAVILVIAAVAWYLGSPLFIRTTANEAFPTTAPAAGITAPVTATGAVTAAPPSPAATPRTIASGTLGYVDGLHNGTGSTLLVRTGDAVVLRFDNVAITNAPDVHVYLSRETGGKWSETTSRYVGPLKATSGSFNYVLPADADLSVYKSVVVWCRQFAVLVTWADLH
jgi:hypothetical protein